MRKERERKENERERKREREREREEGEEEYFNFSLYVPESMVGYKKKTKKNQQPKKKNTQTARWVDRPATEWA